MEPDEKSKHFLSYGAGVNSTALMLLLIKKKYPLDGVVFADTGAELPRTYDYLRIAEKIATEHGIPWKIVRSSNGGLYETCKRRNVIPSRIWRWSTRDYKITPIYAFYRSLECHIFQYVGLGFDEVERVKPSRADYVTTVYPLIEEKMSREDCVRLIREAGLRVPVKSGCFFCPFNSVERWREIYLDQKSLFWRAVRLEEDSKHYPRQKLAAIPLRQMAEKFNRRLPVVTPPSVGTPCGGECMT